MDNNRHDSGNDNLSHPICAAHSGINARLDTIERNDSKQDNAIFELQTRLPVWALQL